MPPNVVIYRENLLAYSETFIIGQAESLTRFQPQYVGTRAVSGLVLPPERTFVLNPGGLRGRIEELMYKARGYAPRLHARLRRLHPVLLHAHFGSDGAMALPLARRHHIPLVVTFHGYDASTRDEALLALPDLRDKRLVQRRPRLIRETALFLAVSEHIRGLLISKGYPAERIVTHYNGIDTDAFPERAAGPPDEAPLVLFVGRMVEKKGTEYLLWAMREVQRQLPEAELVLLGEGPLEEDLRRLAGELGVRCRFLGRQPLAEIKDWMTRASLLCVPSVTAHSGDTEGLPTVIVEAQATGLPVVTTRHAGNPEAVLDGQNGLVVPERDADGLAAALLRLLSDHALREHFGAAARRRAVEFFDARRQAAVLEGLYDLVLAQQAHPASAQLHPA